MKSEFYQIPSNFAEVLLDTCRGAGGDRYIHVHSYIWLQKLIPLQTDVGFYIDIEIVLSVYQNACRTLNALGKAFQQQC